jgi:hypothetical protein
VTISKDVMMLVTFSCPAYAAITMFGDVAIRLLELMGHSGTVPGALLAHEVQPALERLEAAVAAQQRLPAPQDAEPEAQDEEDEEPAVSLRQRALPLIELLRAAVKDGCRVMWRSD